MKRGGSENTEGIFHGDEPGRDPQPARSNNLPSPERGAICKPAWPVGGGPWGGEGKGRRGDEQSPEPRGGDNKKKKDHL